MHLASIFFCCCLFQLVNSASDLEDPLPPKTQGTNSCNYLDESFLWFHVKLTPWKSSLALSLVKCFIMKYAKKICMENHYTLTCFIIRITGELLQTATHKGLVIIYHLSGGGGGCRGEGLCWWRTLLESRLPETPPCSSVHFYNPHPSAVIASSLTFNSL